MHHRLFYISTQIKANMHIKFSHTCRHLKLVLKKMD